MLPSIIHLHFYLFISLAVDWVLDEHSFTIFTPLVNQGHHFKQSQYTFIETIAMLMYSSSVI